MSVSDNYLGDSLGDNLGDSLGNGGVAPTPLETLGSRLKHWCDGDNIVLGTPPYIQTATDLSTGGARDVTQGNTGRRPASSTTASGIGSMVFEGVTRKDFLSKNGAANDMWGIGDYCGCGVTFELPSDIGTNQNIYVVTNGGVNTGLDLLYFQSTGKMRIRMQAGTTAPLDVTFTPGAGLHYILAWGSGTDLNINIDGTLSSKAYDGAMYNACGASVGVATDPHAGAQLNGTIVTGFAFADAAAISSGEQAALLAYLAEQAQ